MCIRDSSHDEADEKGHEGAHDEEHEHDHDDEDQHGHDDVHDDEMCIRDRCCILRGHSTAGNT